jgi:hypothetical protein
VHLEVDLDVLDGTARQLRQAVGVAREVADHRGHLTAMVEECGSARLRSAVERFLGQWGYGMGLVVGDAEHLASMLQAGAEAYRQTEESIARVQP